MPGTRVTIEIELFDVDPDDLPAVRESVAAICGMLPEKVCENGYIDGPIKRISSPHLVLDEHIKIDTAGFWTFKARPLEVVRHKARGGLYDVLGVGLLQSSAPVHDEARLTVYRDRATGEFYFRPPAEMADGRFEEVEYAR